MINTMKHSMPCEPSRVRLIPGADPLAAAFVVRTVSVDVQVQGTGLPTLSGGVKYGGQGSRAWSPPD
jgi:hypothetical protein